MDLDILASKIIHEMFHAYQMECGESRFLEEVEALLKCFQRLTTEASFIQFYIPILFFPYVQKFKHFYLPPPKVIYTYYYHRKGRNPP